MENAFTLASFKCWEVPVDNCKCLSVYLAPVVVPFRSVGGVNLLYKWLQVGRIVISRLNRRAANLSTIRLRLVKALSILL